MFRTLGDPRASRRVKRLKTVCECRNENNSEWYARIVGLREIIQLKIPRVKLEILPNKF